MAFISTGHGKSEMIAIKVDGKGDVTNTHIAWKQGRNIPTQTSPVIANNLMFQVSEGGIATCTDLANGELVWSQRLGDGKEQYSSSPIYADGRVYFFGREGLCTVIEPASEFKMLAANKLDAGMMASPAVAGKALYLRTKTHVYRIEKSVGTTN
jgi:outer membrane protein assembly factor BamB